MTSAVETIRELKVARRAMACEFTVAIPDARNEDIESACAALDEVERLEQALSVYLESSELSRVNREAAQRAVPVSRETSRALREALRLAEFTGGAFDPAAGALVKAWGFFAGPRRVPAADELDAARAASGFRHVRLENGRIRFLAPGVEFNLGAMGKGFALDTAAARLSGPALLGCGQSSYLAVGAPPLEPAGWVVALGHPCRPEKPIAHIRLKDRALGTSGAAHQFFTHEGRRYGHILDPRTGRPAHRLLSATVLAPTAAEADALSTACFVLGAQESCALLARRPGLGAVLTRPKQNEPAALEIIRIGAVEMEVIR